MPSELWDFFWTNRPLLNQLGKLAAHCIKTLADKKGITPGIFIAIHTFGRDLKRNVHVHLLTTCGGLSKDKSQWKPLYFDQATLMRLWRYQLITLFRNHYAKKLLVIPAKLAQTLHAHFTFNQFLDHLYPKTWIVHCAKPSHNPKLNISYLGRYVKRPAIAESKLKHYDGHDVTFNYLDHTTKTYRTFKLSAQEFIARFVQHIPNIHFRMIRYYGFLAHRVSGQLLPQVYQLLNQTPDATTSQPTFASLIQKHFGYHPLACILCGQPLELSASYFGATTAILLANHRSLALLKKI